MRLAIIILAIIGLSSCHTFRQVKSPTIVHDTIITKEKVHDTFATNTYIHDTIVGKQGADIVTYIHDTIIQKGGTRLIIKGNTVICHEDSLQFVISDLVRTKESQKTIIDSLSTQKIEKTIIISEQPKWYVRMWNKVKDIFAWIGVLFVLVSICYILFKIFKPKIL